MARRYLAILIDDEVKRHKPLRDRWKDVFSFASLDVEIRTSDDFEADLNDLDQRPHFVIVDNVQEVASGNRIIEKENRGIDFIANRKDDFNDAIFILSTKASFSIDVLGHKFPNPDLIVPKTALSNKLYRQRLGHRLRNMCTRSVFGRLNADDPVDTAKIEPLRTRLVSVLEQCIFAVSEPRDEPSLQQVNIDSLSGGFSGSLVFRAKVFDSTLRKKVPLVLKVSEGSGGLEEISAYNSFVRLLMPHDMRVDLLGYGEAGGIRGALYAFAVGSVDDLESMSNIVADQDYSVLPLVIERFFASEDIAWYKEPKGSGSAEDFFGDSEEYSHEKDSRRLDGLKGLCEEAGIFDEIDVSLDSIRLSGFRFRFVRKMLESFESTEVPTWIGHGDFNTNNIIFGRARSVVSTIDFEYSGTDIAYKDFVSLECSFRIDDTSDQILEFSDLEARVEEELQLLEQLDNGNANRPYLSAVKLVRQSAKDTIEATGFSYDGDLYALALGFHLFKLLGITQLEKPARLQLLAGFIACGLHLEKRLAERRS